jgi:general stress protein YciG
VSADLDIRPRIRLLARRLRGVQWTWHDLQQELKVNGQRAPWAVSGKAGFDAMLNRRLEELARWEEQIDEKEGLPAYPAHGQGCLAAKKQAAVCEHCGSVLRVAKEKAQQRRGFAAIDPEKRRELASRGGKAAHAQGKARKWTLEQARAAGALGGKASHSKSKTGTVPSHSEAAC